MGCAYLVRQNGLRELEVTVGDECRRELGRQFPGPGERRRWIERQLLLAYARQQLDFEQPLNQDRLPPAGQSLLIQSASLVQTRIAAFEHQHVRTRDGLRLAPPERGG